MVTSPFNPREEKEALAAALCRFHEQWEQERSVLTVLDLCDAGERAHEVVQTLRQQKSHDSATSLQLIQLEFLLTTAKQTLEAVQDEPLETVKLYPLSEERERVISEAIFPTGTIVSCPDCGEGLYKVNSRATTADLILGEGTLLTQLNRDIPPRSVWRPLACPRCGARLFKDGKVYTLQHGWR
jgi:hypothetical protein